MTMFKIICESRYATETICREIIDIAKAMTIYPDACEIVVTSALTPNDAIRFLDNRHINDRIYQIEAMP